MSSRDRSRSRSLEQSGPPEGELSRRDLLKRTAALGIAASLGMLDGRQRTEVHPGSAADAAQDRMSEFPLRRDGVVVIVRSPDAIGTRRKVNRKVVERMVAAGITRLTDASDADHAW